MLNDIAIVVFSLIAVFTRKRWAIITATIWFIVVCVLAVMIALIDPTLIDPTLTAETIAIPDKLYIRSKKITTIVVISFEILFIIIGWFRVLSNKDKKLLQEKEN